jgi:hypothetical protein
MTSERMSQIKEHEISDLNLLYTEGDSVDQEYFAEVRSNILLYAGDHYNRRYSTFYKRIRDTKDLANEQKLRLTKNHIQYICDVYVNNIVAPNPGVGFSPKNEKEIHDQKVAELHHAVWRDAHERYEIDDKIDDWADNFVQAGEAIVKVFYDPMSGPVKAYEQKVDEEGNALFIDPDGAETIFPGDEFGNQFEMASDESKPIHKGAFVFEDILAANLLRPADCKDLRSAPWLAIRKMVDRKELIAKFPEHEKLFNASQDNTYKIFDITKGGYSEVNKQCMVIEYYFRPCHQYPQGYFYFTTKEGVFVKGELPGGIFPIVSQPFRKFSTTPRGRSSIKTMRPYQAEINRSASKMAEHQITLGDDKLLIQNGTKVSAGASLPGVRSVNYTGIEPKILAGRDGSQYLAYMQSNISEMYSVLGVQEDNEELPAQLDPYVMLFRSARQKKKFQRYIKRFEKFLINVVKTYLSLAKIHLPDDELIYAVGATEMVNISEFRELSDICYEINIEAQAEDVETKLGKQIVINHALQYIGNKLAPEEIGKLMRQMPYSNFDASFDDLTIDYDNSVNDLLALDRGERPPVNQYDNHVYCIKRLVARTRKADFKFLPPQVQQAYADKIQTHQEFEAQNQISIQRAQQGLIPTGGYMTVCDLYVSDPNNPNKSSRVRLPSEAIQWLISNLQAQQANLAPVVDMNEGAQAQLADNFTQMGGAVPRSVRELQQGATPPDGTGALQMA